MSFRAPEPLAADAIDWLFSALTVRYGGPFTDRWRDLDLEIVKGDWARQLATFNGNKAAIRFALDHLPEKPPTVIEFKKLCDAAPMPDTPALPYNPGPTRGPTEIERETLRALAADIRRGTFFAKPSRQWAYDLIACHERGWRQRWENGRAAMRQFSCTSTTLAMVRNTIATDPNRDASVWDRAGHRVAAHHVDEFAQAAAEWECA